MIKIDKADSQIVLYAKGHFKDRWRTMEDVRKLVAYRAAVLPSQISDYDIIIVLTSLMHDLEMDRIVAGQKFISRVIFDGEFGRPIMGVTEKTPMERFVFAALGEISTLRVREGEEQLIELQPIDLTIFE